jgi:hypothetical protein
MNEKEFEIGLTMRIEGQDRDDRESSNKKQSRCGACGGA